MSYALVLPYRFSVPTTVAEPTPDLLWYKMNEGSSNILTDSSSHANSGVNSTADGNSQYVTGKSGSGFALQTLTAHSTPNIGTFTFTGTGVKTMTVCCWLNASATQTNDAMVFEISANAFSNDHAIYFDYKYAGDATRVGFSIHSGASTYREGWVTKPSDAAWHHWAVVYDASVSGAVLKCYIDSSPATVTYTVSDATSVADFGNYTAYLGSRSQASLFWDGTMDDFRLYTYELSQGQVTAVYNDPQ